MRPVRAIVRCSDFSLARVRHMASAEIGLIGLGVMGANLALNIAEHGSPIAVYNRTAETTAKFHAGAGALASQVMPTTSLREFVAAIRPPRPIIIMVTAG